MKHRILFPVLETQTPSGGRKFIYHTVDMLNEAGLEAWVIHPYKNFRLNWFENSTKVGYCLELFPQLKQKKLLKIKKNITSTFIRSNANTRPPTNKIRLQPYDIIVLPEGRLESLHKLPLTNKTIIFNQGPYLTFNKTYSSCEILSKHINQKKTLGIIVVSLLNEKIQKLAFPQASIKRAQLFIEPQFHFSEEKKIQLAYMPRRGKDLANAVFNLLRLRGLNKNIKIIPIDNLRQDEVTKVLSESLIFLSFAEKEGFGLPAAEAMACGCIVIGFTGNGGNEFFNPEYCYPIHEDNLLEFVQTIEDVLLLNKKSPETLKQKSKKASNYIRDTYSRKRAKDSLVAAFSELLDFSDKKPQ